MADQKPSTEIDASHDHEKCCRYLRCAHPKCCGYYGEPVSIYQDDQGNWRQGDRVIPPESRNDG